MTYRVAGMMFNTRLEAMRASVEWFATAGGDNEPHEVAHMMTAEEIADDILAQGWELPDETDRDELVDLAQHVIDCAYVSATLYDLGTEETERLLCQKMNVQEVKIEGSDAMAVIVPRAGGLSIEQVADFGRWLRETS